MLHFNQQRSFIRNKLKCINKIKKFNFFQKNEASYLGEKTRATKVNHRKNRSNILFSGVGVSTLKKNKRQKPCSFINKLNSNKSFERYKKIFPAFFFQNKASCSAAGL